jgi:hypothetical protein
VDESVYGSKVAVFFIDDLQVVRPGEVGSYRRPLREQASPPQQAGT